MQICIIYNAIRQKNILSCIANEYFRIMKTLQELLMSSCRKCVVLQLNGTFPVENVVKLLNEIKDDNVKPKKTANNLESTSENKP